MSTKLIALGNRLMGDDGVAVYVAEKMKPALEKKGIEVIIGETDYLYCLDKIEEKDSIIVMDATCFGILPGTLTVNSMEETYKLTYNKSRFSQHGYSLITAIKNYYSNLEVLIIGIEGEKFNFDLSLSPNTSSQLDNVCYKVEELCEEFIRVMY